MSIKRRDFLRTVGTGAVAAGLYAPMKAAMPPDEKPTQQLHPDYHSDIPGSEYFFLGNGLIQAVVQVVPEGATGTHCGVLIMSPEHFGRKISTFLYHPERGLERTRFTAFVDGKGYLPEFKTATVSWKYPDRIPTIVMECQAGACRVTEEFFCPAGQAVLVRSITVRNISAAPAKVSGTILLSPNFLLFDEYSVDREKPMLTALGYHRMQLFPAGPVTIGDRHMAVDFGSVPPGELRSTSFMLTLDHPREDVERHSMQQLRTASTEYWSRRAALDTGHEGLNHLFMAALTGIRAAVAASGKMDGGIWQYNQEWVRDQSMVATASTMLGHDDIARALFERILSIEIDDEGKTIESSRLRPPETFELDQNGELLYTLRMNWAWTGDDSLIRRHWKKIASVADFLLRPVFYDPAVGLLKNTREYWERDANFGIREGYEITYQLFAVLGLEAAADMAGRFGTAEQKSRWAAAAAKIRQSFVAHPKFSLVDDGHFIKRRLATGEVQTTIEPVNRKSMPPGMPLNVETTSYLDPDSGNVLPIAFEVVDPRSALSLNTLKFMEKLWNERWDGGGYGRYEVTSEPDSPGPWPFASLFIARAYLEAGDHAKAWRVLNWLLSVEGGKGGAWFEMYGSRPTPPLPPVGIVPWNWAELALFFVHHMLGIRPSLTGLVLRPTLLAGLKTVDARIPIRKSVLHLVIRGTEGEPAVTVDGKPAAMQDGKIEIPFPAHETTVEFSLRASV